MVTLTCPVQTAQVAIMAAFCQLRLLECQLMGKLRLRLLSTVGITQAWAALAVLLRVSAVPALSLSRSSNNESSH